MVTRVKGGGRVPPPLHQPGLFFHHDGLYARNWTLPLCVYSVVWTFYCILDACRPVWSTCKPPPLHFVVCDESVNCYEMLNMQKSVTNIYAYSTLCICWVMISYFDTRCSFWLCFKQPLYSGVWGICRLKVLVLFGIQWTCTLTIFLWVVGRETAWKP